MVEKHPRVVDSSDEDSESDDERTNLDDMTIAQLKKAVRDSELEKNNAEKKLRWVLGDVTNSSDLDPLRAAGKKKSKKKRSKRERKRRRTEEVPSQASDDEARSSDDESGDKSEAESSDNQEDEEKEIDGASLVAKVDEEYDEKGRLRGLLDIISDRYKRKVRKQGWFKRAVIPGGNCQPTLEYLIRHAAVDAIYDCRATKMRTPADRRKFRKEIGWYEHEDGEGGEYDGSEYDIHTCFLNPVLPMCLYVALIRGPAAAAKMLDPKADVHIPKTDNMELIHEIDHTEAGAIAGSCVLAIWGKSPDVHLNARGDHTNIDYKARFDEYLDILTTGLRKKSPSILHVFAGWDRIVFPDAEASCVDPPNKQRRGKSDGYRRAMEAMAAEVQGHHSDSEECPGEQHSGEYLRFSPNAPLSLLSIILLVLAGTA
ncbi:hypothetical protein B0H14DRAFT_3521296 [Mycena olivaceomarginata]|nr:hypothetical protein B0H14DRAFT_3521296 [Mycena olivaceomarginata]